MSFKKISVGKMKILLSDAAVAVSQDAANMLRGSSSANEVGPRRVTHDMSASLALLGANAAQLTATMIAMPS